LETSNCSLLLIYLPRKDERLSQPGWLTYSGRFTHISGHPSATGRAQDSESSLVRDRRSTTEPRNQPPSSWPTSHHISDVATQREGPNNNAKYRDETWSRAQYLKNGSSQNICIISIHNSQPHNRTHTESTLIQLNDVTCITNWNLSLYIWLMSS